MGLSMFAPVNSGSLHSQHYPSVGVKDTALDPYYWRGISMAGGGIHSSEAFWTWVLASPSRISTLRAAVEERKSLRHFAVEGDLWLLSPTLGGAPGLLTDPLQWAAWQLHREGAGDGVVTLIRRPRAPANFTLSLHGLPEGAASSYNVSYSRDYGIASWERLSADELRSLVVTAPPATSLVVRYERLD